MTVKVSRPSIDIRGTLDELNKPSGIAGNAMLAAETPQEQFNLIGAGRRNLIINGGFDVWQRGASFTSVGSGYSADRFFQSVYGGATPNITKVAGFGDFRNAIRYTGVNGGASEQLELEHRIEGGNLPQTGMLTLSYWVRGSKAGSFKAGRLINGTTGVTNTGRADVEVSTDWSRVTVTVSALAATDAQYYRLFWADSLLSYMSDDSVWLEFTGVQLEIGSVATPFEHRLYGEELALCQRYYEVINEINGVASAVCNAVQYSSTHVFGVLRYAVAKRAVPSISLPPASNFKVYSTAASTVPTSNGVDMPDEYSCRLVMYAAGTGGNSCWIETQGSSSTPFAIDAEFN